MTSHPGMRDDIKEGVSSKPAFSCLVVEDHLDFAGMIETIVGEEGGVACVCATLREARQRVACGRYDVVILDNHLPDGKGFDFYAELRRRDPAQTVIVLTGQPELGQAVELTRQGLFDYLAKPVDRDSLAECLRRAWLRFSRLRMSLPDEELVAATPAMREVTVAVEQAARHPSATILFTGETGTGKDAAVRRLHRLTHGDPSPSAPLIPVNCAAIPADMFEGELFGAERGAYTGADRTREGLAGSTKGGTLFLDEIGEVPLAMQAKLLRFLEAREFRPLGSSVSRPFRGRVVAATHRSLREEVAAGRFREDLLYRLDVFTIHLPPLRDRREEIPALAEILLRQLAEKYGRPAPQWHSEDVALLCAYRFPGNVRELRNLIERSLLRTPPDAGWMALDRLWLARPAGGAASHGIRDESGASESPGPSRSLPPLDAREYAMIREAMIASKGGIRRAAATLGISHQALLRRLEKWPELRQTGLPLSG